jgi:CHASE2 domain-containing sensor protein
MTALSGSADQEILPKSLLLRLLMKRRSIRSVDGLSKKTHYASLFDSMKQATVISVDVIMTEPSNDDFQVAETAARNENVILAVYLNSALNKVDPVQALSSLRNGHVHVEESIDSVVRGMFHAISTQDMILHSLTSLMCETMTSSVMRREKSADRKSLQAGGKIVFQTDQRRRKNHVKPPGSRTSRHFSSY